MSLAAGTRLGPYEIGSLIGKGAWARFISGAIDSKITCIDARGTTAGREIPVEPERRVVEVL